MKKHVLAKKRYALLRDLKNLFRDNLTEQEKKTNMEAAKVSFLVAQIDVLRDLIIGV